MADKVCTCDPDFVRVMRHHGDNCPARMIVGSPEYYESLKADALAGKLFQGATIAWLVQRIGQLGAVATEAAAMLAETNHGGLTFERSESMRKALEAAGVEIPRQCEACPHLSAPAAGITQEKT